MFFEYKYILLKRRNGAKMIFKNEDQKLKTHCKISDTDKFWDISEISPIKKQKQGKVSKYDTDAVVVFGKENDKNYSSVIQKRKIPENNSEFVHSIIFEDSLIIKADIYTWPSKYTFYERFRLDAEKYFEIEHEEVQPVRYYSYMPSYAQMSIKQREWYFYWRSCVRQGKYLPTDSSYILLYVYEIINLPELIPATQGILQLLDIWEKYRKSYTKLDKYMAEWVCDYCLVNNVELPKDRIANIISDIAEASIFKQFYLSCNKGDEYALLLLEKSVSYRWRKSRYINDENKDLFEKHIKESFLCAVKKFALFDGRFNGGCGRIVEKKAIRDSFGGSLCAYNAKRKIEVFYYDLANVSDIAFVVNDMVKYCENRIRAHLGIRARLGVQNLTEQQKNVINEYFDRYLPSACFEKSKKNAFEDVEIEERKPFSVSFEKAKEIEKESWAVTDKLIEEFFEETEENENAAKERSVESESLDIAKEALLCIVKNNTKGFIEIANDSYMLPETLVECVNELCFEILGDIGIEEKDGEYVVIPEYEQEIRQWLKL